MSPKLLVQLETAKRQAAELARRTDELNRLLSEAEDAIVALNLGVWAGVAITDTAELSFRKHGDSWGLYVLYGPSCTPILHASRALRTHSASKLPKLLDELFAETERCAATVDAAIGDVTAFLERFPHRPGGSP